jgi:hypothetical protein
MPLITFNCNLAPSFTAQQGRPLTDEDIQSGMRGDRVIYFEVVILIRSDLAQAARSPHRAGHCAYQTSQKWGQHGLCLHSFTWH